MAIRFNYNKLHFTHHCNVEVAVGHPYTIEFEGGGSVGPNIRAYTYGETIRFRFIENGDVASDWIELGVAKPEQYQKAMGTVNANFQFGV